MYFLNNHLRFLILYHHDLETDLSRIVGFEVEPFSVKHTYDSPLEEDKPVLNTCHPGRMKGVTHSNEPQLLRDGEEVIFSYDVLFEVRFNPVL